MDTNSPKVCCFRLA